MVRVYKRWTYVQLAFQRKRLHANIIPHNIHVTKKKRKQMWKGGECKRWTWWEKLGGGDKHGLKKSGAI